MSFLDLFSDSHRQLFEGVATPLELVRGQYLLRRGEPGGDIFLVRSGTLDVVDSRSTPEVILVTLEPGAMVGELAFIDDSPRSADVRAGNDAVVLRWARDDLRALLRRHPDLGAVFYAGLSQMAAQRIRSLTQSAVSGTLLGDKRQNQAGIARAREDAEAVADEAKALLLELETRLRHDPKDEAARGQLAEMLDRLEIAVDELFTAHHDPEHADEAARTLCRELHPYLVRSALADRCIRRPQGLTGTAEILSHVLVGAAGGDGQVGELIDRWLLDRPMLQALRALRDPTVELVSQRLPRHRNRRVMVVNAGTGSLVAGLVGALGHPPTVLTVVDQSRDALAFLDGSVLGAGRGVELVAVQENLARFAVGRHRARFVPQDAIVLHGLLEYLPDRLGVSLLEVCRSLLVPGGVIVASALGPSRDRVLLDRLLTWPTIRRTPEALRRIFGAADLTGIESADVPAPALLLVAKAGEAAKEAVPPVSVVANAGAVQ